jgi:hypothetical protein
MRSSVRDATTAAVVSRAVGVRPRYRWFPLPHGVLQVEHQPGLDPPVTGNCHTGVWRKLEIHLGHAALGGRWLQSARKISR